MDSETSRTDDDGVRYWRRGDLNFVSLGEFGALAWGVGFPLRHVPHIPEAATTKLVSRKSLCGATTGHQPFKTLGNTGRNANPEKAV